MDLNLRLNHLGFGRFQAHETSFILDFGVYPSLWLDGGKQTLSIQLHMDRQNRTFRDSFLEQTFPDHDSMNLESLFQEKNARAHLAQRFC